MTCLDAISELKGVIKNKPSFLKKYKAYREKNKNFDENQLIDWLPFFDSLIDSKEGYRSQVKLRSNFSKRFMYDLSLVYNRVKCNIPLRKIPWWHKVTNQIYLGALPFVGHIESFKKMGVTSVLSIVESFEREKSFIASPVKKGEWEKHNIRNIHLSHPDFIPVSLVVLYKSACALKDEIAKNERVYVHCKAGRGRSASAILSYFIMFKGWSFEKAFNFLKSKRSHIAIKNKRFKMEILKCLYEIIELKKKKSLQKLFMLLTQEKKGLREIV